MSRHAPAPGNGGPSRASSWFGSTEGRRYLGHFGGLIALKVVLLAILYFVFIAPQPRAGTTPEQVYAAVRGTATGASANSPTRDPSRRESTP